MVIKNLKLIKDRGYYLLVFLFLGFNTAICQPKPKTPESELLGLDPSVRYGKLENGFTYYLQKSDSLTNTIDLHLVVKGGTYHEDKDQLEYAHLIEHMGYKSTKNFPDLPAYFNTKGLYVHAGTRNLHTFYFTRIPSGDKSVLDSGLLVLRDWSHDIRFDQQSIDVEREAILGEMRVDNPYNDWFWKVLTKNLIKNTGAHFRDQHAAKKSILDFDKNAFLRYYKDWYRPDLEAAIIVGDINVDSVETQIQRLFSDLKTPDNRINSNKKLAKWKVDFNAENQYISVLDTLKPGFRLYIASKRMDEKNPKNVSDYKAMLLRQLYEIILEPRIKQLKQQLKPPFSEFFMTNNSVNGQLAYDLMKVDLESDEPRKVKNGLVRALSARKQIHKGVTDLELDKAKKEVLQHYSGKQRSNSELVSKYENHFVSGTPAPDPKNEFMVISKILNQIDINKIQSVFNDYGDFKDKTDFLFFRGKDQEVPGSDTLTKWLDEIDSMTVDPLEPLPPAIESLSDAAGIPEINEYDVELETEHIIGVTEIKLKNGIKLFFKPLKPISERNAKTINIHAFRPNNIPIRRRKEYLAAKVVPEVLKFTGAGSFDKFQLENFKKSTGLRLSFELGRNYQKIYATSKERDIDELLNLLYLRLKKPLLDKESFSAWKSDQKRVLNEDSFGRGNPNFFMDDIRAIWYPDIPNLKLQDLEDLTMKKVSEAHQEWYSNLNGYTFIISGDFDREDLTKRLVKKMSAFPVTTKQVSNDQTIDFPFYKMDKVIRLSNLEQSYVSLYFPVTAPRDIKTQVELMLLSKALHKRIWDRLREGCYAPGAWGEWMDINNGVYSLNVRFNSELGNESKLTQMAIEEFRKLKKFGVDRTWFENAVVDLKENYGKGIDYLSTFSSFWPEYLQDKINTGEDIENEVLQYEAVLDHFTSLEDINAAADKYLSEENMQKFLVLPKDYVQKE